MFLVNERNFLKHQPNMSSSELPVFGTHPPDPVLTHVQHLTREQVDASLRKRFTLIEEMPKMMENFVHISSI